MCKLESVKANFNKNIEKTDWINESMIFMSLSRKHCGEMGQPDCYLNIYQMKCLQQSWKVSFEDEEGLSIRIGGPYLVGPWLFV